MDSLVPSLPLLLVLRALEDGPAHGYRIALWVEERSEGVLAMKEGTLYPLLHQLERQGLIAGSWTPGERGRPTKVYTLTDAGRRRLAEDAADWQRRSAAASTVLFSGRAQHGLV